MKNQSILAKDSNSAGIRRLFSPTTKLFQLGSFGQGDSKMVLWESQTGVRIIETNGDPVYSHESGFDAVAQTILNP